MHECLRIINACIFTKLIKFFLVNQITHEFYIYIRRNHIIRQSILIRTCQFNIAVSASYQQYGFIFVFFGKIDNKLKKYILEGCEELGLVGKKIAINDGVRAIDLIDMKSVVDSEFLNGAKTLSPMRMTKDETELAYLRKAAAIADKTMEDISLFLRKGLTEKEVQKKLFEFFEKNGSTEPSFSPIVASGPGGSMPRFFTKNG